MHAIPLLTLLQACNQTPVTTLILLSLLSSHPVGQSLSKLPTDQSDCALSIVTPRKTIDLVAGSKRQRDDWVLYLRQFVHAL